MDTGKRTAMFEEIPRGIWGEERASWKREERDSERENFRRTSDLKKERSTMRDKKKEDKTESERR
eukprot:1386730-Amorphochlora_amoeboformis.AAC.1